MEELFHGSGVSCAALNDNMIVYSTKSGDLTFLSIKNGDNNTQTDPKKLSLGKPLEYLDWKGSLLVVSSSDNNVCAFLDTNTFQVVRTMRLEDPIVSISISPRHCAITEYRVVIGTRSDHLYLVTNETQRMVKVDSQLNDVDFGVNAIDNGIIAVAMGSGHVALYDEQLRLICKLAAHALNSYCVSIDPLTTNILTGGGDALATFWQIQSDHVSFSCKKTFGQLEWPIHAITSYNKKLAISSDNDTYLLIIDVPTGDFWKPFRMEKIPLKSALSPPISLSMNHHGLMIASERSISFLPVEYPHAQ